MDKPLKELQGLLDGELFTDRLHRTIYATDASVYRKVPRAVAYPKNTADLRILLDFAHTHGWSLTPRAAGTSLAGQTVGEGIIVDISRHFTSILDLDTQNRTVTVQPGVIRDELNQYLQPHGLFFGPNTSTSNRCMIGGMVGNNSSGTTSIKYGVTRDKVVSMEVMLTDGRIVHLGALDKSTWEEKCSQPGIEGRVYSILQTRLSDPEIQRNIRLEFPKPDIHRRNTGYALDALLDSELFGGNDTTNLCKLICGSEGTLALVTAVTLALDPVPPTHVAMIVPQYHSISDCLEDVKPVMQHDLYACEMMDKVILDCTAQNKTYAPMRFFIEQDPKAVLLLEVRAHSEEELDEAVSALSATLKVGNRAYVAPVLYGEQIHMAMELRKAGLGLLGNMVGDKKAVACIEDTAVSLEDLTRYIADFESLMEDFGQQVVYYAHAGAGELHLRPILNLKTTKGVQDFRAITTAVSGLVKRYRGSLSGEHGDGIVRAEFLKEQIGVQLFDLLKEIKNTFDPDNILNPGKITDAWPMDRHLRYSEKGLVEEPDTFYDFSDSGGILHLAENCNGSGDCRKTEHTGGTMCPSYQASREEKDTTRARANALREVLTNNEASNRFASEDLKQVLDLCLGCKGCSSECPSNVDVALMKSEFEYQARKAGMGKASDQLFGKSGKLHNIGRQLRPISNWILGQEWLAGFIKKQAGIHPDRSLPKYSTYTLKNKVYSPVYQNKSKIDKLILYVDEFTRNFDGEIAQDALDVLLALGYTVQVCGHLESARALISKGYLEEAKAAVLKNMAYMNDHLNDSAILVGIEPSAILGFRDEFPRLVGADHWDQRFSRQAMLFEEFIQHQWKEGHISSEQFTQAPRSLKVHKHCHQKALGYPAATFDMLNLPTNYTPVLIPSGCCGMAGSFGFEQDHYQLSINIGELRLFPAVRKASQHTIIVANGTSCRHQIADGTGREALHPISILKQALI